MQSLRSRRWLPRLVLAWFALTVAAAVASPVIRPAVLQLVCTAAGDAALMAVDADGNAVVQRGHTLDCPACWLLGAPPPGRRQAAPAVAPVSSPSAAMVPAPRVAQAGAPLPPRGPPVRG